MAAAKAGWAAACAAGTAILGSSRNGSRRPSLLAARGDVELPARAQTGAWGRVAEQCGMQQRRLRRQACIKDFPAAAKCRMQAAAPGAETSQNRHPARLNTLSARCSAAQCTPQQRPAKPASANLEKLSANSLSKCSAPVDDVSVLHLVSLALLPPLARRLDGCEREAGGLRGRSARGR